jgi:Flp pilus assembly protein TadD
VRLAPDLVVAHVSMGQLLAALGRGRDAVGSFQTALRYDPRNMTAYGNLLPVLAQMGDYESARRYGEQAVTVAPQSFETRFNLGLVYVAQRRYADGIAQFRAAQQLRPEDPRPKEQIRQAEAALGSGR